MADQDEDSKVNPVEEVEETKPETEETKEPEAEEPDKPEKEEDEPSPSTEAKAEEYPEKEEQQPSRRESKRINQLLDKLKAAKSDQPQAKTQDGIDYRKMIEAPDEVYDNLDKASQEYGQQQYNAGREEAKSLLFQTRLEIDAPRVEAKYPQFDKDSADFDPAVSNAFNSLYLQTVGYDAQKGTVQNSNVRYGEFIDALMDLAGMVSVKQNVKSTQNIAKQAASTGLRPDGSSPKELNLNKAPQEMTKEELNAVVKHLLPTN